MMIRSVLSGLRAAGQNGVLRLLARFGLGLGLIALLVYFAADANLIDAFRSLRLSTIALALGLTATASLLSAVRWQVLLRSLQIREPLLGLANLYLIGQFCSLFLPTAAGGDAYRMYQLTRRGRPLAAVVLATLQERLLGLASVMLVGLAAAVYYREVLPARLVAAVWVLYSLGLVAVLVVFAQKRLRAVVRKWVYPRVPPALGEFLKNQGTIVRVRRALEPLRNPMPFRPWRLARAGLLAMTTCLLCVSAAGVIAHGLGIDMHPMALCLIVSLVGIIRMVPATPGGIGVGDGAFVYLAGLCGVMRQPATAMALALLAVQTAVSLFGGMLLLRQSVLGKRRLAAASKEGAGLPTFDETPVVILAGGLATRLRPITERIPKAMVEVAGKPFIDHQLELLRHNGVRQVVLCLGYLGEQVERHVGDGSRFGLKVAYCYDGATLLGTGGALRRALPLTGEACWVLYGDSYLDIDYRAIHRAFCDSGSLGLMTVLRNGNQWDRSNVVYRDGRLLSYDKRNQVPEMEYIDFGASLFRREALERLPEGQVSDLADLMSKLAGEGSMAGFEMKDRFYEIGSPQGLRETAEYLTVRARQRAAA
jgi:uncharacterized protein (TIRG00374 family)